MRTYVHQRGLCFAMISQCCNPMRPPMATVTREHFDNKFSLLQWMLGTLIAGVAALIIKAFG